MARRLQATVEDLYRVAENARAELVDGELVLLPPPGEMPGYAADVLFVSLRHYVRRTKSGRAVSSSSAFLVDLPNRGSFSPCAAFYVGPQSEMEFFKGAPDFAVEVRSEADYGPTAEESLARKRADYFAAGTRVVWDVDLQSSEKIRVYRHDDPEHPAIYRAGDIAEAEPAVPGWRFPVNDLFEP
jgi:Uma2 family endonuclease